MNLLPQAGAKLPIYITLILLVVGGWWLLKKADMQARDTIRKHHLEDIEHALYFARDTKGTYPPYDQAAWCGRLTAAGNELVLTQVEQALRAQNEKYTNPQKPFPRDPLGQNVNLANGQQPKEVGVADYFYWKHSPASFELFSILETDPNGERTTVACPGSPRLSYDYGLTSVWRENQ